MKVITPKRRSWRDGTKVIRIRVREEDLRTMDEDWVTMWNGGTRSEWAHTAIRLIAELIREGYATDLISVHVLLSGAKEGRPFGPPNPVDPVMRERRGLHSVPEPSA